jgi:hypothetical protein
MNGVEIRKMRNRDMARFSKTTIPPFVGYVGEKDGKEIGAAAIVWGDKGRPFMCLEATDDLRKMPVLMHKFAKRFIAAGVRANGELFAMEKASIPSAARWLKRLGFSPTDEILSGERVWIWRPS